MICRNCGNAVKSGSAYCQNCGKRTVQPKTETSLKAIYIILAAVVALLIVAVLIIGALIIGGNSDNTESQNNQQYEQHKDYSDDNAKNTTNTAQSTYVNYTVSLLASDLIYKGPGYEHDYVQSVGVTGIYTIVQQQYDSTGTLWGQLKSGAGWVVLKNSSVTETANVITIPAEVSVFTGPGYDEGFSDVVGRTGQYTIIDTEYDSEGNVWGKLKSGAGWVDITALNKRSSLIISANYVDEELIQSKKYIEYNSTGYAGNQKFAIRAYKKIRDVKIVEATWGTNGMQDGEVLFTTDYLGPDRALVTNLSFPGDFSTYYVYFKDDANNQRKFTITQSLRNGELIFNEDK